MDTSGLQKGATYPEIKARVLEQTGLKVSSLYISQIKQKCGLEVQENYHKAKSESANEPPSTCTIWCKQVGFILWILRQI